MLQSLRYGFATNSSSSHSIIFSSQKPWTGGIKDSETYALLTPQEKITAILPCINSKTLTAHQRLELAAILAKHGLDPTLVDMTRDQSPLPHLDLQGIGTNVPKGIDIALWMDMLMDDSCSIHGYPDTREVGEEDNPFTHLDKSYTVLGDTYYNWRWRQDGEAIVGFNCETGMKFRWAKTPYTKSAIPELVDVKITDYCGFKCAFCYQGSTTEGLHAPTDRILSTFQDLAGWGVFEIAIGGGEPIAHPDFETIMRAGRAMGLSLSFTTFNKAFDKTHPSLLPLLNEMDAYPKDNSIICGSTGVSVHGPKDVEALNQLRGRLHSANCYRELTAQTVVGATPMRTIERTLDVCVDHNIPLLLLGYKTTGRGEGRQKQTDINTLRKILLKAKRKTEHAAWTGNGTSFSLSVDTAFLDLYSPLLDDLDVPLSLRSSPEGKFSMYVDAVTNQCGPSSYNPENMLPYVSMRKAYKDW